MRMSERENNGNFLLCRNFTFKMQQHPRYKVTANDEFDVIEFVSIGIKGNIDKIIHIEPTHNPLVFNLAFGDKIKMIRNNETIFGLDDKINSENGDRN
jgi:hypothetical protein